MSVSSTSNLTSGYVSSLRGSQGAPLRVDDDALGELLRASLTGGLKAGTTVTATYRYQVAEDGTLYPTETNIRTQLKDTEADGGRRKSNRTWDNADESAAPRLSDVQPIKVTLSPVDEIQLFGGTRGVLAGEGVDATGTILAVEILTPDAQTPIAGAGQLSLAARAQQGVAQLYARNNDAVFLVSPLANLAA